MRRTDVIGVAEATRAWAVISLQTFGGPAGQIAVMQRELVDKRGWIGQRRFLHALNYCMLLPGPEAQQLSVYIGWLLNGARGGLIAGSLFVLPGFFALLVLSVLYVAYGDTKLVTAVFAGVAPAVLVVVAQALWRVARRALHNPALVAVAGGAFAALLAGVPFPAVIGAAALAGWSLHRWRPHLTASPPHSGNGGNGKPPLIADDALYHATPSMRRTAAIFLLGLAVWAAPTIAMALLLGPHHVITTQGVFFSGTALVTFGGAYAVLAFVAQQAVVKYAWLSATDMVRGLALAESTPGPLIMVVQFVAFLGAYHNPGPLNPWAAGVLASVITVWATFVPSFLFIFLGAPYVERLRGNQSLTAALSGITAAVVGVIASLAVYFAASTLWPNGHLDWVAVAFTVIAAVLTFAFKLPMLRVLAVSAGLGVLLYGAQTLVL